MNLFKPFLLMSFFYLSYPLCKGSRKNKNYTSENISAPKSNPNHAYGGLLICNES